MTFSEGTSGDVMRSAASSSGIPGANRAVSIRFCYH